MHGAGWTFVVWGGLHGAYLIINHGWRAHASRFGVAHTSAPWRMASVALTFIAVVVGWVFFRADNFATAWNVLAGMTGLHGISLPVALRGHLSVFEGSKLHSSLRFDGLISSVTLPNIVFIALLFGSILVWAFPNLQRLLEEHMSAENSDMRWPVTATKRKSLSFVNPRAMLAVMSALLFFVVVLAIRSDGPSEFLYFEF
ncbi:hypothetical protein NK8_83190 (plasmid) [Caballeronia sp. NK8]|nr:hypothetical protein NK8_83190 [Caballeronia sp. NK8]